MARHRRLLAAWGPLTATVRALLAVTQGHAAGSAESHAEIVHAIESGDPAAAALMVHLDQAGLQLHASRRRQGAASR